MHGVVSVLVPELPGAHSDTLPVVLAADHLDHVFVTFVFLLLLQRVLSAVRQFLAQSRQLILTGHVRS